MDANPVETYDSGDEWDIGVGNLIIDLDADLEKDQQKLEMSGSKEVGIPAPNAVATLPDNIKFVTPVPGPQGKEGKSTKVWLFKMVPTSHVANEHLNCV